MFEMNWLTICLIMRNVTALVKTILQVFPEPRVEPALLPLTFARPSADVYGAQWNTRCTDPDRRRRGRYGNNLFHPAQQGTEANALSLPDGM